MKHLFLIIALAVSMTANAQFKASSSRSVKDTLVTKYTYTDVSNITYKIILRKDKGWCYIWRTSKKTGKKYTYYLSGKDEYISRQIAKEYKVNYVEHKTRK